MTDDRCRYAGTGQPRVLVGRHEDGCENPACSGCQECTRAHCRVCSVTHSAGVCGGCMTAMRDDLAELARMYADLPDEVEHRGINGEAMSLLGPVADPEAWGHHEASAAVGRTAEQWTDGCDFLHPLWVTGSWASVYREAFEHEEPTELATVAGEVDYLSVHLHEMANYPHVPVEDFAQALRKCRAHLEDVLLDGERAETGAPCVQCRTRLQRHVTEDGREWWWCRACRTNLTEDQYRYAVGVAYKANADRLPAADLAERVDVPASTIRRWAAVRRADDGTEMPPLLRSVGLDHHKRKVYRVADAETLKAQMRDNPDAGRVA